MNGRDVVQRLRAFDQGRPLPRGETIHFTIADDSDALVLAFIRMGGESRPWGIAFGRPHEEPVVLSVPEGRNRDLVADMCATLAPVFLGHLRTPGHVPVVPTGWEDLRPLRQIWLPNSSHLDMLHHLAYAYTFTDWGDDKRELLNAFGRACGWLFREAQRPGQQHVLVATQALRESFVFPAQDVRQGHLGFLLAWLREDGDLASRWAAAAEAERRSMSASLDPAFEREIEPLVEAWLAARRAEDESGMKGLEEKLQMQLAPELASRHRMTVGAVDYLRADDRRVNTGVATLVQEGVKEQWFQHTRLELKRDDSDDGPAFTPSPETDRNPAAAGSRYQVYLASEDLLQSTLLHDDREMQAEAIAAGDAFRGEIRDVRDEGEGHGTRPVWTIVDPMPGQLRLREGSWVCVVGLPSRKGEVRAIEDQKDGTRRFEVEITGWKTKPDHAADPAHVGELVTIVKNSAAEISRRRSRRIWENDVPGAWLTHALPSGPKNVIVEEAAETVDLDNETSGADTA